MPFILELSVELLSSNGPKTRSHSLYLARGRLSANSLMFSHKYFEN